jgi:hypothetical protein
MAGPSRAEEVKSGRRPGLEPRGAGGEHGEAPPFDRSEHGGTLLKFIGRPSKLTDAQKVEARRCAEGATLKELAESYDVGPRGFRGFGKPKPSSCKRSSLTKGAKWYLN